MKRAYSLCEGQDSYPPGEKQMNNTHTTITVSHAVSEKFRRAIRILFWETLDEGVVLFFRVKTRLSQIQQATQFTSINHRHLLVNR